MSKAAWSKRSACLATQGSDRTLEITLAVTKHYSESIGTIQTHVLQAARREPSYPRSSQRKASRTRAIRSGRNIDGASSMLAFFDESKVSCRSAPPPGSACLRQMQHFRFFDKQIKNAHDRLRRAGPPSRSPTTSTWQGIQRSGCLF